jgi:hypothetical protein
MRVVKKSDDFWEWLGCMSFPVSGFHIEGRSHGGSAVAYPVGTMSGSYLRAVGSLGSKDIGTPK